MNSFIHSTSSLDRHTRGIRAELPRASGNINSYSCRALTSAGTTSDSDASPLRACASRLSRLMLERRGSGITVAGAGGSATSGSSDGGGATITACTMAHSSSSTLSAGTTLACFRALAVQGEAMAVVTAAPALELLGRRLRLTLPFKLRTQERLYKQRSDTDGWNACYCDVTIDTHVTLRLPELPGQIYWSAGGPKSQLGVLEVAAEVNGTRLAPSPAWMRERELLSLSVDEPGALSDGLRASTRAQCSSDDQCERALKLGHYMRQQLWPLLAGRARTDEPSSVLGPGASPPVSLTAGPYQQSAVIVRGRVVVPAASGWDLDPSSWSHWRIGPRALLGVHRVSYELQLLDNYDWAITLECHLHADDQLDQPVLQRRVQFAPPAVAVRRSPIKPLRASVKVHDAPPVDHLPTRHAKYRQIAHNKRIRELQIQGLQEELLDEVDEVPLPDSQ